MPYAPLPLFSAFAFQPLSWSHSFSRHGNWSIAKPAASVSAQPVRRLPLYSSQDDGIGPAYGEDVDRIERQRSLIDVGEYR